MASVTETDRGIRIRSYGNWFAMMFVWGLGFFFIEGLFSTLHETPWIVHGLAATFGLLAFMCFVMWRSLPRVWIDARLRVVVLDDERIGWDELSGIQMTVEIRPGPRGSKFKDYNLWLLRRDRGPGKKIMQTSSEDECRRVRGSVADLMQIERLPDGKE